MTTSREEFEAWYREQFAADPNHIGAMAEWITWQAATERAAKLVEQVGPKGPLQPVTAAFAAAIRGQGKDKQ